MTDPVVLFSSRRGLAAAFFSPVFLLALASWTGWARSVTATVLVIGLIGALLAGVVLVDFPLRTEFRPEGIMRVCPIRHQVLAWSRVVAIERAPGRARVVPRRGGDTGTFRRPAGLAALVGKRRYLLTDRVEGALEYDRMVLAVKEFDTNVVIRAKRPPLDTTPTDLYRRRRG